MSVQTVNLPLGVGRIFVKRTSDADGKYRLLGTLKGEATFTYTKEEVEQKAGDVLGAVRRDVVDEMAQIKGTITDLRHDQLIFALGVSISTTQLTATQSIRLTQEIATPASTTTTKSLSRTAKSMTSVQFVSLDRSTSFVRGTDYTLPTTKKFKAISAAFKNKTVRAFYTKLFTTAQRLRMGDQAALQQVSIMYVHHTSDSKAMAITFHIATISGDLALAFKEKEYTTYDVLFKALADPTKAKGNKLFQISRE